MPKLLIAASGTGGHLFPALAVADALPKSWSIVWLGVPDRLETKLVPKKYPLFTVKAGGIQGGILQKAVQFYKLLASTKRIFSFIKTEQIQVIFTTGGYISAPAILAGRLTGIPVLLHESNAIPGKATRLLGRFCNVVAIGLPIRHKEIPGCTAIHTGTPIRSEFLDPQPLPTWVPKGPGLLIVVIGGSQGAVGLNKMMNKILPSLLNQGCKIVHLVGEHDSEAEKIHHKNLIVKSFCDEMPGLLQHADLAISRAGAGSLTELAISGTPTIFVPFPYATDYHQDANACCAAELGGAIIVHEHPPEHETLKKAIFRLITNKSDALLLMRQGMNELAIRNASEKVIGILEEIT